MWELFEQVNGTLTGKIRIGLIDHDKTLRPFQECPQSCTGMQHACRGIGVDDDHDLGPMGIEVLWGAYSLVPWGSLSEDRILDGTERLVQRVAGCWRCEHIASTEKGTKNDRQNIIGTIPCNDLIHLTAIQLCSRLPQTQRHRVGIQPQILRQPPPAGPRAPAAREDRGFHWC